MLVQVMIHVDNLLVNSKRLQNVLTLDKKSLLIIFYQTYIFWSPKTKDYYSFIW